MPLVRARVRMELSPFVVDARARSLSRHLQRRQAQGYRVNVNLLGEAVLGDEEELRRTPGRCACFWSGQTLSASR